MSAGLLDRGRAVLVVIDVQEAFRKAVPAFGDVAARTAILVQGAAALGLPVLVTEQYPRGLGDTVPEVAGHLGDTPRLPKTVFSAARAEGFDLGGRDQALVCGIEAHVCVAQTVLDLLAADIDVQVARDATASRTDADRDTALHRLEQAGATLTSVEAALFELLGEAGTPEFKTVQELIR
jgi:nicotinamidase-related amidase